MIRYFASARLHFLLALPTGISYLCSPATVQLLLQLLVCLFTEWMVLSRQEASNTNTNFNTLAAGTNLTVSMHTLVPHSIVLVLTFLS